MTDSLTLTSIRPFTDLTTLTERGDGEYAGSIAPTWTIGPKVHGGCMIAVCAAAARSAIRAAGDDAGAMQPVAVSASYLAAPDPGEVRLVTAVRKRGRQVCLVDVELRQGDTLAVSTSVTLAVPDATESCLTILDHPALPPEPTAAAVRITTEHPLGRVVNVANGCDLRVDPVAAPYLRGVEGDPVSELWIRPLAGDEADPDTAVLFALMTGDISPPVTMNRGLFGWAPTVQLTTFLRRVPPPGWLRVRASAAVLGDAWFDEDHQILDSAGEVIVQSRQLALMPRG